MNASRKFLHAVTLASVSPFFGATTSHAAILVNLSSIPPLYDSDVKGIVNDGGNGPGEPAGHASGIPALDTAEHVNGFTFNITFNPTAADLAGTRLLIEIGGTSNGSGLYLVDGVPTFIGKQGANDAALPTSLNDTTLNTIAVQSSSGKLLSGTEYSFSVSWNQAGTLELKVAEGAGTPLLNSFAISGAPGNWSGNDTLSVATLAKVNAGGLSGNNAGNVFGLPFDVDNASSFLGNVSRALFWNASAVTPLTLTSPVVQGFRVTKLPTTNKVRLHWNVTEGGLANPTTLVIRNAANSSIVHTPVGLSGFADVPAGVTDFILTATNATGSVTANSGVEADNSFSTTVRADSPSAWFRFNENAGSRLLVDSAENAVPFNGTLLGSPVTGASGFIDGAGAFEGGSAVTSNPIFNPGALAGSPRKGFSIETVVRRRASVAGNHILVSQTDVNGVGRAILGISENGTIFSQIGVATPTAEGAPNVPAERKEADEKLEVDRWAHLVLVVDAGIAGTPGTAEIRWYLDGRKIGSSLDGVNPDGSTFTKDFVLETSSGNWVIGSAKSLASEFWKGDIDDVAIYPKLLDDPNGDGDVADSKVVTHHGSWYAKTAGILSFKGSTALVSTGGSVILTVTAGADVSSVSIDNGVGNVPLVNGIGTVSVTPSANTTYRATATGTGGPYTRDFTVAYQQLTAPVILGFEKTSLPTTNQVRLHWKVSAGAFATPTTITLDAAGTSIPNNGALNGFVDVSASQGANVTLTATNSIGSVSRASTGAAAADTPFSAEVRQDTPVAWFRFNETSGSNLVVDSAENAQPHNGTTTAASVSTGATGFIDGAGSFDGARGILTDRIIDLNTIDTGFTIEAIVRTESDSGGTANRAIVSQQDLNGTGRLIASVDETGVIRSVLGGGVRKDADTKVPDRGWSHLVVVANAITNEIRWYVDGQPAGTSKDGRNPDGTEFDPNLLFEASNGAWAIGVNKALTGNFWKGQIDEIAIYDTVLDELPPAPDADPNAPATIDLSRIVARRNAWRSETSGLIYASVSASTIEAGQSTELTLSVGPDVTSVVIDQGVGNVQIVNGKATVILSPSVTTTYQITLNGPGGPVVSTITITVNGSVITSPLRLVSSSRENGNYILNFAGSPSTTYYVRGSTDLVSFNVDHGTAITNPAGTGTATIAIDPQRPKEFFRIQSAP